MYEIWHPQFYENRPPGKDRWTKKKRREIIEHSRMRVNNRFDTFRIEQKNAFKFNEIPNNRKKRKTEKKTRFHSKNSFFDYEQFHKSHGKSFQFCSIFLLK